MVRIVLDTSVLISAIGWKDSKPRRILDLCINKDITLLISKQSIKELKYVLFRSKFDFIQDYIKDEILILINKISELILVKTKLDICRDKCDNKFIELAIDGNADYIISSDEDLLTLKQFGRIKMINPNDFIELIKSN